MTKAPVGTYEADYDEIAADLAYAFEGVFSPETVARAVADARARLEPSAKVTTFLPVLVRRFAREQLIAVGQVNGSITHPVPENSVAIASNESFSGWTKTFTDPRLCAAIVDRDVEYAEVVERAPQLLAELEQETARGRATYTEVEESEADLERFHRWLASIEARDYFHAPGHAAAAEAVERCRAALAAFEATAVDADLNAAPHPQGDAAEGGPA